MKKYSSKWITQRITALLLIPLTFWFIYNCISFQKLDYVEIVHFFDSYFNSLLFLLFIISMLLHSKLGCETIIEDYINSNSLKNFSLLAIKLITYCAYLTSIISILIITF